jgi:hypothetical protein
MDFSSINYLAVVVSGIAAWGLGTLWYSGILFGKAWQKELGFTDEFIREGNMPLIFGSSLVLMMVMALGMAMLISGHGENDIDWMSGLFHGLYVGIFFVGASMAINLLYQRKSFRLWAIDAIYQILFLAVMGAIIGAWQ